MSKTCIFLADGFETIEALTVVDMLRRAGEEIVTVSITGERKATSSHNVTVETDAVFEEVDYDTADVLALPGGMPGTANLAACEKLMDLVKKHNEQGKVVAAICAAPGVLGELGLLRGKRACCFPGCEEKLLGAEVSYNETETDGNIITSRGMGTAVAFSAAILAKIAGEDTAKEILNKIVYRQGNV